MEDQDVGKSHNEKEIKGRGKKVTLGLKKDKCDRKEQERNSRMQ